MLKLVIYYAIVYLPDADENYGVVMFMKYYL
jgi:hypothetical protein